MSLTLTACSKVLGAAYWASSVKKADRLVTFPECCVCACLRVAHEFWMGSFCFRVQRFWVHWLRAKQWWGLLIGNCDSSEKWHFHVHVHEFVCIRRSGSGGLPGSVGPEMKVHGTGKVFCFEAALQHLFGNWICPWEVFLVPMSQPPIFVWSGRNKARPCCRPGIFCTVGYVILPLLK